MSSFNNSNCCTILMNNNKETLKIAQHDFYLKNIAKKFSTIWNACKPSQYPRSKKHASSRFLQQNSGLFAVYFDKSHCRRLFSFRVRRWFSPFGLGAAAVALCLNNITRRPQVLRIHLTYPEQTYHAFD